MKKINLFNNQRGFTLMEIIAVLGVAAGIILGALKLFDIASSSSTSLGLLSDISTLRTAAQGMYNGQGGYGTNSLNQSLVTASKVPTDLTVIGNTINTEGGGTVSLVGNTTNFNITVTNLGADQCTALVTNGANGWSAVRVGSGASITQFPVSPDIATAAANCGGTPPFSITWTTIN